MDSDGDGTPDCHDACPADPHKTAPGQCGCGVADIDTDHDGIADCIDPDDDNDGIPDGRDNCPLVANRDQRDTDGDGIGDACDPLIGPPRNKDQCKNGGWARFNNPPFRNQGQCVSFVEHHDEGHGQDDDGHGGSGDRGKQEEKHE